MSKKSLIVFVISVFLFSALALTDAYASKNHGPSTAGIEVYDANGQYLGVLDSNPIGMAVMSVYVPSLSKFIFIGTKTGNNTQTIQQFWFQSDNCTGISYLDTRVSYDISKFGEEYYTGARTAPIVIEPHSKLGYTGCSSSFYKIRKYVVPAEEVPADSLPFTFPVALPLEFK